MSILSHNPKLSKLAFSRSIALLVTVAFFLAGSCFFLTHAEVEKDDSESEKWEQKKAEKMEMAKVKAAKRIEWKTKKILAKLNLSYEDAEGLAPKIEAVLQHRMVRGKALRPMLKDLKKTMIAGDDATVASALEEFKNKRSALGTELEALEASLLEGLTPRQEALLTLSGVVGIHSGFAMFKDWRGHGKNKFKDHDHRRDRRHRRHGHGRSKHDDAHGKAKRDCGHGKSKHDYGYGKWKHGHGHGKPKHDYDKSKHDHDKSDYHH